jgi:hypothetical protein
MLVTVKLGRARTPEGIITVESRTITKIEIAL